MFARQGNLQTIYDRLRRAAIHAVKPDDIATFPGRKPNGNYQDEMGNRFNARTEGTRIKHLCSAGHTVEHLEETGIAAAMRSIMLNDRLLGVGVRQARMEILGGMMPDDDRAREGNLERACQLGREF